MKSATVQRRRTTLTVAITLALWVAATVTYLYGAHHILTVGGSFELFAWVLRAAAFAATFCFVVHALVSRTWSRLAAVVVISAMGAVAVTQLDPGESAYRNAYNDELATRHADLISLAAAYKRGDVRDGAPLPQSLRVLSRDDRAHVSRVSGGPRVLFIQRWQDWRAESGDGIAYFASPPAPGDQVVTASGDIGSPTRDLGDGWWVVPA